VVIETTGIADPGPVLQIILTNPMVRNAYALDGVVTTVDAVNGLSSLASYPESVRQVAVADRIVITKTDLAEDVRSVDALRLRLRGLNPGAKLLDISEAGVATLFDCGLYNPATKTADVRHWLGEEAEHDHEHHDHDGHDHHEHGHHEHGHRHDSRVRSYTLIHDGPVPLSAIEMFLDLLRSTQGDHLLRMKGIIELSDDRSRPLVIHGVQKTLHPPIRLAAWPDEQRGTRLVLITLDMPQDYVQRLFAAFTNRPSIDTPDRAALEANPLAIAGG
jgi:G3E family GTPase